MKYLALTLLMYNTYTYHTNNGDTIGVTDWGNGHFEAFNYSDQSRIDCYDNYCYEY